MRISRSVKFAVWSLGSLGVALVIAGSGMADQG